MNFYDGMVFYDSMIGQEKEAIGGHSRDGRCAVWWRRRIIPLQINLHPSVLSAPLIESTIVPFYCSLVDSLATP